MALKRKASCIGFDGKPNKFGALDVNAHLELPVKLAALKISSSIVSLVSYSGEEEIFQSTGTIIESDSTSAIVLTSAYLLRCPSKPLLIAPDIKIIVHLPAKGSFDGEIVCYDFHYNVAAIRIHTSTHLSPASLAYLNDSLPVDTDQICSLLDRKDFGLKPHSKAFNISSGDPVTCVGRYFSKPYRVMAAPGVFRAGWDVGFECKELFFATCRITKCGVGGPLVNCNGDVIGLCFYLANCTPFLPINLVLAWWEQFKKHGEHRRPLLGMELKNLCLASLEFLDGFTQKFPNVSKGVYVMEVTPGSSADAAGLKSGDVIIKFSGKAVGSSLELIEESWRKVGKVVKVVVLREDSDRRVRLRMMVAEATRDKWYRWSTWNTWSKGG